MADHLTKIARREQLWTLAKIHQEFTAHDLSAAARRSLEYVREAFKEWVKCGFLEQSGKRGSRVVYRVTSKAGNPSDAEEESVQSGPFEKMWFAIRHAGGPFTYRDIAMMANSEATPVTEQEAQTFCQMLANSGYLRADVKADGRGRLAIYRLIQNTGPIPPRERRVRGVWDENKQAFTHIQGAVS